MLLNGRPLYDNQADSRLFVNVPTWNPVMKAIEQGLSVLVLGRAGIGKTTLLRQIQMVLRESGEEVAFVEGTGAGDVLDLAARVRLALMGQPSIAETAGSVAEALGGGRELPAGASRQLGTQLQAIGEAPPAVILLDGPSSPEAVFDLFGRMRDVLWQQPHRWVVTLDARHRSTVLRPPADAFFDLVTSLDEDWSTNSLADLLARRAEGELPGQLIAAAAASADGNPREALRALSYGVVNNEDPGVLLEERGRLLERASLLGRAPAMLLAELLDRGRASPSDVELQESLGVTRARLTQLFNQLKDDGLVVSEPLRGDGPGRPRTVFRPDLPHER
jgi:energy-coupling factor transporter ATP-binding protein EcfA2